MSRKPVCIFIFFTIVSAAVFASGSGGSPLSAGVELYSEGRLQEAADEFRKAAASEDGRTASAGYYNLGTVQAELAARAQTQDEKKPLLESAYESLKRAADIGRLPAEQMKNVRKNMQVVREELSKLPPPEDDENRDAGGEQQDSGKDKNGQQENNSSGSPGEQSDSGSQQNSGSQQKSGARQSDGAQSGNDNSGSNADEMKAQQQDLRERTESGSGSDGQLADEQRELQKSSGNAGFNEAAQNQAKAAEALDKGNREAAAEYQKAAEQAFADAAAAAGQNDGNSEADDILDSEADRQKQQNRLDSRGGITDAERNW